MKKSQPDPVPVLRARQGRAVRLSGQERDKEIEMYSFWSDFWKTTDVKEVRRDRSVTVRESIEFNVRGMPNVYRWGKMGSLLAPITLTIVFVSHDSGTWTQLHGASVLWCGRIYKEGGAAALKLGGTVGPPSVRIEPISWPDWARDAATNFRRMLEAGG